MLHNPTKLRKLLKENIVANGAMPFKDFMAECLYHKEFGYYSNKDLPIGKHGDFVTAPHASRFFGSLLSVQIVQCFDNLGEGCCICEFGAGAGFMAQDVLSYLKNFEPKYFDKLVYFIVEPLEQRRPLLEQGLSEYSKQVKVISDFSECCDFSGVILANELLDAFPVHVVHKKGREISEVYVDIDADGEFCEVLKRPRSDRLINYLRKIEDMIPYDYRTEVNLAMEDWIKNISSCMERGYVLIIDYGYPAKEYFAPHRNRGTLIGYSRQRTTEDFFSFPGMVDMTAHVNFTDLRKWAELEGLRCEGFTPQWAFLGGLDPDIVLQKVFGAIDPFSPVLAGIKALIFPQAMGETHKAIVFSKGVENSGILKGFGIRDYQDLLK